MQERQIRIATVLAAMLAVLLILNWTWKSESELDPEATAVVWSVAKDDVVKIAVDRPQGRLVVEKGDDGWEMLEPVVDLASDTQVGFLLDDLERVDKGVPIPDADPAEFGLAPPEVTCVVTRADGSEATLEIGEQAPVGWRTYVKDADGGVAAIAGTIGERLQKPADDLREPHLMRFDLSKVRRVVIESAQGTLDVHGEGNRWWVEGWTRADPDAVDDLITGLRQTHVDSFYAGDPAPAGFADPAYRVTIELEDGETTGFEVGGIEPPGALLRGSDGRAGWAPPDRLALLGQGPTDVGDPHALPLDPDADDQVEVDLGDTAWSATRDVATWKTADGTDVTAQVEALAEVPIRYRRDPGPALAESWATVTVRRGDAAPRVVDIGQEVEGTFRVAQDRDGGEPYLVPLDALEAALPQ